MELSRRQLVLAALKAGLGAHAAALVACASPRSGAVARTAMGSAWKTFNSTEATVLGAAMETLLPRDERMPGAQDVNALGYMDAILAAPRASAEDRDAIMAGVEPLQERARARYVKSFERLALDERTEVLRSHEVDDDGRAWMALLLVYALEALLTDPIYGGNTQGIGWAWLGHQPGLPRPSKPWWQA